MSPNNYDSILHRLIRRFPSVAFISLNEPGWPVTFISENVQQFVGIEAEAFLSGEVTYGDLIHPDDFERVVRESERNSAKDGPETWELDPYRIRKADGTWIWVQDRTLSIRDEDGNTTAYEGILSDVSKSMEMAERLQESLDRIARQSEEHLDTIARLSEIEAVVSSSSDLLILLGPDRTIRYANTAFLAAFDLLQGWSFGQPMGSSPTTKALELALDEALEATKTGESSIWKGWLETPHKGPLFFTITTRPFVTDEGLLDGAVIVARDRTSQHRRNVALQRLAKAVHHVSESVVITDAEGTIEYVNPFFEHITGYSAEEAMGANPRILKGGTVPKEFYQNMWGTLRKGKTWKGRFVNRRKNGELFTEDATISPILDAEDEITHFVAVKRDVSNEVSMQQQVRLTQQFETHTEVFRTMLHELNNGLSVITGHAELLEALSETGATRPESVRSIREATHDTIDLVNSVLKRLVVDSEQQRTRDLAEVVTQSCNMIRRILPETVSFEESISSEQLPTSIPESELDQVVTNLVLNAEQAIDDQGSVHVLVEPAAWVPRQLQMANPSTRFAKLVVSDTGRGMDDHVKENMFNQFFSTKASDTASGLGLWMVKRIVTDHGGDIDVESSPGSGTAMTIWLPLDSTLETPTTTRRLVRDLSGLHVLVVDDDHAFLEMTSVMLSMQGVEVTALPDPLEVLEWLKTSKISPSVVVTDLLMPNLSGTQLAEQIRELYPGIPIVFMSGYSEEVERFSGNVDQERFFLQKPFEADELLDLIGFVLPLTDQPAS